MDFVEIAIILMLCILSFLVGQKMTDSKKPSPVKNEKYKSIPDSYEDDDEVFKNNFLNDRVL